ncbi:MAG TPA: vWA domain-containing protein, partial [Planctomycetota bacterium]|nr:vWA domain-containing protein [Planctomycetota bacterium]
MKEVPALVCLLGIGTAAIIALTELRQSPPGAQQTTLTPSAEFALLLIVDKSGGMAGRNIEIVKEACVKTAKNLSAKDVIGVLAFDFNPTLVLEFTEADRIDYIEQRILRLLASGGTRIYPALVDALRLFELDPRAR